MSRGKLPDARERKEKDNRLDVLKKHYTIRDNRSVLGFVRENTNLISLLREAPAQIRRYFSPKALILEVPIDSDADEEKQLMIYIQTDESPRDVREKLKMLDNDWWLKASNEVDPDGKLGIHVEFN